MGSHNVNRRGALIELAAPVALLAFLFIAQPVSADTITFFDTNDAITVGQIGSQHNVTLFNTQTGFTGSCSATETYDCDIVITSPNGATPTSSTMGLNISEAGVDPTQAVSDSVYAEQDPSSYLVIFASDPPGDPSSVLGLTPLPGAPSIGETGGVQTAFTLSWSDGTQDVIRFQSDLDAAPEPGTLALFGSGFVSIVGFARRKLLIRA